MAQETDEEFIEQMEQDAAEERANEEADAKRDYRLENDYGFFREEYDMEFEEAISALEALIQVHKKHNVEFDIKEIADELRM